MSKYCFSLSCFVWLVFISLKIYGHGKECFFLLGGSSLVEAYICILYHRATFFLHYALPFIFLCCWMLYMCYIIRQFGLHLRVSGCLKTCILHYVYLLVGLKRDHS